jgi:hypothetical protein
LLRRLGATAPPTALAPLFVGAVGLLVWYPLTLTGEWVELLAGGLFLAAAPLAPVALWAGLALTLVIGPVFTAGSEALGSGRDPARVACAEAEVKALLDDITTGQAAMASLGRPRSVHKRVWTAVDDGYLDGIRLASFASTACGGVGADGTARQDFGVDPWGTAYWLSVTRLTPDQHQVTVYSFGPNRRRDGTSDEPAGDDVVASGQLTFRSIRGERPGAGGLAAGAASCRNPRQS